MNEMWEKYGEAELKYKNKTLVIWRRIRDGKEEFTLTKKAKFQPVPKETSGYYAGRESLRNVMGIDLSNGEV